MNPIVIKGVITLATNRDARKKAGKLLLVFLSPLLIVCLVFIGNADASKQHNEKMIHILFENEDIPVETPVDLKEDILKIQEYFEIFDGYIEETLPNMKEGTLDGYQIKTFFFVVYIREYVPELSTDTLKTFFNCFIVSGGKEEDNTNQSISDIDVIKNNIETQMNVKIDEDMLKNYHAILDIINPGLSASTQGDGTLLAEQFKKIIEQSLKKDYVGGSMRSPFIDDWRSKVTSEFGHRDSIVLPDGTATMSAHTGLDMGANKGTAIVAVNDGEVVYVRNHQKGLGLHLAIDHGGGILSVYGHTSKIVVKEGDKVKKGQKIAEVGTSGYSTGNHLHLEIWEHGKEQNPRNYLD